MKSENVKNNEPDQPITKDLLATPKNSLTKEQSLRRWLLGPEKWNSWMKDNPGVSIDFKGVHFNQAGIAKSAPSLGADIFGSKYKEKLNTISFEDYIFNGNVDFSGAKFPTEANFKNTSFEGEANFSMATFESSAIFQNSTFNSDSNFSGATFIELAMFSETCFASKASFRTTSFGNMAYFPSAIFNKSTEFSYAEFNKGTDFLGTEFNCDAVFFDNIKSRSIFTFIGAITFKLKYISFKGGSFDKDFIIGGYFNCVPDLRGTKLNHHTELSDLRYTLKREKVSLLFPIFKAQKIDGEASKLCRLKELAEQNKNHEKALMFHADEMRAKRWTKLNTAQSILDLLYSATSNYGQSIIRPLLWLFLSFLLFSSYLVGKSELEMREALSPATTTSIATMTPFISVSKDARQFGVGQLFNSGIPKNYYLWSYAHASASFVFIFLIGLGLRNRFRI